MANLTGQLFIDGLWLEGHGDFFESLQPVTGETVWDGVSASIEDVDAAVREAREHDAEAQARRPADRLAEGAKEPVARGRGPSRDGAKSPRARGSSSALSQSLMAGLHAHACDVAPLVHPSLALLRRPQPPDRRDAARSVAARPARRCARPTKPSQSSRPAQIEPNRCCSHTQEHRFRAISRMQAFLCRKPLPPPIGGNANGKHFRSCESLG